MKEKIINKIKDLEGEVWKEIEGYDGAYMISNMGRVKSVGRYSAQNHWLSEKLLSITHAQAGYCDVSLYKNGKRHHEKPHRLVAQAFVSNPRGLNEVDHIDMNKDNNRWDNLRWVTHSENHLNPLTVELKRKINLGRKLTESQINKMSIPINVIKDEKIICTFNSFHQLTQKSKEIVGIKLWEHYARKVLAGARKDYHGYTFSYADINKTKRLDLM